MTIGELLLQLWNHIYGFWPLRIINEWELGVLVRAGQIKRTLDSQNGIRGSGLHWFCPGISEIWKQEANTEVVFTPSQTHTTEDGVVVSFNFALRYAVVDLAKTYGTIHEVSGTLVAQVCAHAGRIVAESTYEEIRGAAEDCDGLANDVWNALVELTEKWGIDLQEVELANLARVRALRVITGAFDAPGATNPGANYGAPE